MPACVCHRKPRPRSGAFGDRAVARNGGPLPAVSRVESDFDNGYPATLVEHFCIWFRRQVATRDDLACEDSYLVKTLSVLAQNPFHKLLRGDFVAPKQQ